MRKKKIKCNQSERCKEEDCAHKIPHTRNNCFDNLEHPPVKQCILLFREDIYCE